MCGLVGVIGNIGKPETEAMSTLLILDSLRGTDSTGVATITREDKPETLMAKSVGHPYNLFDMRQFEKAFKRPVTVVIGHNRFATQGKVNAKNAHPFEMNTLIGAHNGTLNNKHLLADHSEFQVDSENLFHHIETLGLDSALDVMSGAWALTWFDLVSSEMCFLRNKERPLYISAANEGKSLFWASEKWMLEVALERHKIKFSTIALLKEDVLMRVKVETNGGLQILPVVDKPSTHKPVVFNFPGNLRKGYWGGPSEIPKKAFEHSTGDCGDFLEFVIGYKNEDKDSKEKLQYLSLKPKKFPFDDSDYRYYGPFTARDFAFGDTVAMTGCTKISTTFGSRPYYRVFGLRGVSKARLEEYPNARNQPISKDSWERTYGICTFCTDDIEPSQGGWAITTEGECLCPSCVANGEIIQYVKIAVKG